MRTVWNQDRSVGLDEERDWNIATVWAYSCMVMYEVQQNHGPQESCRHSSLLRSTRGSHQTSVLLAKGALQQSNAARADGEKEVAGILL